MTIWPGPHFEHVTLAWTRPASVFVSWRVLHARQVPRTVIGGVLVLLTGGL